MVHILAGMLVQGPISRSDLPNNSPWPQITPNTSATSGRQAGRHEGGGGGGKKMKAPFKSFLFTCLLTYLPCSSLVGPHTQRPGNTCNSSDVYSVYSHVQIRYSAATPSYEIVSKRGDAKLRYVQKIHPCAWSLSFIW